MKSDDPRLIESHKRLTERIAKLDEMVLIVLKNHIAVEQSMGEFLEAHSKKSDNLTFADKIKACKARNAPEIEKPIWDLLKEANRLRNTIAHKMDEKEIKAQMLQGAGRGGQDDDRSADGDERAPASWLLYCRRHREQERRRQRSRESDCHLRRGLRFAMYVTVHSPMISKQTAPNVRAS